MELTDAQFGERMVRARSVMVERDIDAMILSVGADLPYLCGYTAMALERLTMFVVTADPVAKLVIPELEAPRVTARGDLFELVTWSETDDPIAIVASLLPNRRTVCVGDTMWARFVVELIAARPDLELARSTVVMNVLRAVKDEVEIQALRAAAHAADRVAAALQTGQIPLIGRAEADVSAELGRRLLEEGHDAVNFAIVASGPNAASPHHDPGSRVIGSDEIVLCDFGGTMDGYCSDITRCVHTGPTPGELTELYAVLHEAQAAGVAAGGAGGSCQDVDRASRRVIDSGGYGDYFIHRTGHGIGMEAHEDPYMVEGNLEPLVAGHAFSVEPGIYVPGRWGARLEDIVVARADGPDTLNQADHSLIEVPA